MTYNSIIFLLKLSSALISKKSSPSPAEWFTEHTSVSSPYSIFKGALLPAIMQTAQRLGFWPILWVHRAYHHTCPKTTDLNCKFNYVLNSLHLQTVFTISCTDSDITQF